MTEITIQIKNKNQKVLNWLIDLEKLQLIKIISPKSTKKQVGYEKFCGILNKKQGRNLNSHVKKLRTEWKTT